MNTLYLFQDNNSLLDIKKLPLSIQTRILSKKHPEKQRNSLAGYLLLQKALEECYTTELTDLNYSKNGKPFIPTLPHLHFSISHSKNLIGVALSTAGEIGLDIEHFRKMELRDSTFAFFSPVEKESILQAKHPQLKLIEYWSKKEALIKAIGSRMFDIANLTNVTKNPAAWNGKNFFFNGITLLKNVNIWIASPFEVSNLNTYTIKDL